MEPLAELAVADSRFLGFCFDIQKETDASSWKTKLQSQYPGAAHIAVVWKLPLATTGTPNSEDDNAKFGFDEDNEPPNSVGPGVLRELRPGLAIVIVRFFQEQLLGVTCGRLPQCYQALAKLTVHRFTHGKDTPMEWEISHPLDSNIYGLAAGDCELITNVVSDPDNKLLVEVQKELNFDGFRGAAGEILPRLQNLQADLTENLVPVYRYPGNYNGQEWDTFQWGPVSFQIKQSVEQALQPLVNQTMNHCVANLYRDGTDFIEHHSDKDLDLNRKGVIVSVSLGDERILELRRRTEPKDTIRVPLPHGSMLVLGPITNKQFSHSILRKEGSTTSRISLTMRDVATFLDLNTGRLFGEGVDIKSLSELRKQYMVENIGWFGGFCAMSACLVSMNSKQRQRQNNTWTTALTGFAAASVLAMRYCHVRFYNRSEEKKAREFFSKNSLSGTKY